MEPPDSPVWAEAVPAVPGEASPRGDGVVSEPGLDPQVEPVDLYVSTC